MKRFLALLMIMSTLLVSMTGCGSSDDYTIGTSISNEKEEDKEQEITVWCWDPGFNGFAIEEAAKLYKEKNSDVKVNIVEYSWWDIQQRVERAVLTGQYYNLPDIFLMQDTALTKNVHSYTEMFADLSSSGIDFSNFASFKTALSSYEGKQYGLPFDSGAAVICYRVDILGQAGYTLEDFTDITWEQFLKQGKTVLEKTGKPLLTNQMGASEMIMLMLESAGGSLFDQDGEVHIEDNKILKEVINIYKELVDCGVVVEVNDWNAYTGSLQNSEVAGAMNGSWITGTVSGYEDQKGLWEVTNIPSVGKFKNATNYSNQGGASWLVMNYSKNRDLAIDFLASTLGSNVDLYDTLLSEAGVVGTYLPAASSEAYEQGQEFFNGQKIYQMITQFSAQVPEVVYGVYNDEARNAVGLAVTKIVQGTGMQSALKDAENEYYAAIVE